MVRRFLLVCLVVVMLIPGRGPVFAQAPADSGGGAIDAPRDLTTDEEWARIDAEVAANLAILDAGTPFTPQSADAVSFQWPLRAAANLSDYGYHGVSGFMDHSPTVGVLQDYTCGARTYDMTGYNHQGTDFFTYPFPWYKVANRQVEVVAAAAGTLAFKRDGQYDRQCAMTGALSNAVVIRHADGSLAHYLHMKNGSVTTKAVGSAIAVGEVLGVVASSGSSTGPHLHFEVRNASNVAIDPFNGACSTSASLWAVQPAYYDSKVTAVHTGFALPVRPACPQTETPNTADRFEPDDTITFITYYRDQLAGQQSVYRILRPDGSVYKQWTHASTAKHYTASYWYWSMKLDQYGAPPEGTWTFDVAFQGATYRKTFTVGDPTPPAPLELVYPNGGETLIADTNLFVWWDDALDRQVSIALYAGGVLHTQVITSTLGDGMHVWHIPQTQEPRTDYRVRIATVADPAVADTSDGLFTISNGVVADFSGYPVCGTLPLTVTFSDKSAGSLVVDRWAWAFGDGMTSTLQHPTHTYAVLGAYTVTLTVGAGDLEDTASRPAMVVVLEPSVYLPRVMR